RPRAVELLAEEVLEEIAVAAEEVLEVEGPALELRRRAAFGYSGPEPLAEAVVLRALFGVGEHLVGARGLLEFLLGLLVARSASGVVLQRELADRLLDLVGARAALDAEDRVVVARFHGLILLRAGAAPRGRPAGNRPRCPRSGARPASAGPRARTASRP